MAFDSKNWMNTLFGVSVTLIPHPSCVDPNEAPVNEFLYFRFKKERENSNFLKTLQSILH